MVFPAAPREAPGDAAAGPGLGLRARIGLPWGGAGSGEAGAEEAGAGK
jgi:hypothetical protein